MREYWESMGVHLHEIYADQSDLKNADYHAARDGDYKPIKTEFLNPFASVFISTMKEMRLALQNEEAYRGKMFMAPEAAAIGMIDGILTKEAALADLGAALEAAKAERDAFAAKIAELEATKVSASKEAAKIAASVGVEPTAIIPGSDNVAAKADVLATYNSLTDPKAKADFFAKNAQAIYASIKV